MRILFIAIALLFSQLNLAADKGFVVIASNHPEFEKGAIINQTQFFNLESGQSIKLVSSAGKVTLLQGPYTGSITFDSKPDDSSVLESVSELVKGSKPTDFALAIFRNPVSSGPTDRLDIWGVDISKSGSYCVRQSHPVYLWWRRPVANTRLELSEIPGETLAEVNWPAKTKHVSWPDTLQLSDMSEYSIANDTNSQITNFKIFLIPLDIESDMELVAWMSDQKCKNQATRLLGKVLSDSQ